MGTKRKRQRGYFGRRGVCKSLGEENQGSERGNPSAFPGGRKESLGGEEKRPDKGLDEKSTWERNLQR